MKTNMGVFFGGSSVEHEVAIISAVQAMNYIDRDRFNVVPVYITKDGEMFLKQFQILKNTLLLMLKTLFSTALGVLVLSEKLLTTIFQLTLVKNMA